MGRLLILSHIDRTGERYFHIASWWWLAILGYIISLATMTTGARYFSLFLMSSGFCGPYINCVAWIRRCSKTCQSGSALTLNWVSNVIPRPPAKRSAAMGLVNGIGNVGSVCVFSFRVQILLKEDNWTPSVWDHTYGKQNGVRGTISRWSSRFALSCSPASWVSVS